MAKPKKPNGKTDLPEFNGEFYTNPLFFLHHPEKEKKRVNLYSDDFNSGDALSNTISEILKRVDSNDISDTQINKNETKFIIMKGQKDNEYKMRIFEGRKLVNDIHIPKTPNDPTLAIDEISAHIRAYLEELEKRGPSNLSH